MSDPTIVQKMSDPTIVQKMSDPTIVQKINSLKNSFYSFQRFLKFMARCKMYIKVNYINK